MSSMIEPLYDYQFRLILIGDSTVGKSSLLRYFTDGKYSEISDPTVGVDFYSRIVRVRDGSRIKLQLWDTAGQERFRSITKSYYRNSVGVVLSYDITQAATFRSVRSWMLEAKRYIEPITPVYLILGCKSDMLESSSRQVSIGEVEDLSAALGVSWMETSAKNGTNVEEAFTLVAQEIYNRLRAGVYKLSGEGSGQSSNWDGIKVGDPTSSSSGMSTSRGSTRLLPIAEPVTNGLHACC